MMIMMLIMMIMMIVVVVMVEVMVLYIYIYLIINMNFHTNIFLQVFVCMIVVLLVDIYYTAETSVKYIKIDWLVFKVLVYVNVTLGGLTYCLNRGNEDFVLLRWAREFNSVFAIFQLIIYYNFFYYNLLQTF